MASSTGALLDYLLCDRELRLPSYRKVSSDR